MERNPSRPYQSAADAVERIRKHLDRGAPWDACDAFREAIAAHPADADLLYWGALAHARSGATHQAHTLLDQAQAATAHASQRLPDILSLRGRLWKDAYHRAPEAHGSAEMAERARKEYLAAYALQHDPYPGINAATLSWLLGDRAAAKNLAQEIVARLDAQTSPRTCWDHATTGEALLLLGRFEEARSHYAEAYRATPGDAGTVATMRRQVNLLARELPETAEVLSLLPAADVVAFAGHMIDASDRRVPRFPAALESAVRAAVGEFLAPLHTPIVYTSAACGADLIFIEAALEHGAEVNVVLPFDHDDFLRTSVAVGGDEWIARFEAALSRANRVIMATEENHLDDDVLFEHAAMLLEGFTVLRAAQLETGPQLLCVLDPVADGRVGGTHASFERWQRQIGAPHTIDLAKLRSSTGRQAEQPRTTRTTRVADAPRNDGPAARPQRTLKTLVFADFAGSSRLHDAMAPLFQESFWKIGAAQIEASRVKPLLATTWGDAVYAVFDSPSDSAEFALSFLERMREVDWTVVGLPDTSSVRIALHAGPVFRGFDPIMGRDNYFGSSVTKAARIEPVTPPGMVYASEAFAATLAATGQRDFTLEYVGQLALAKGYGASRIYRLERR
ncbi:MAG TPA: adenylate/guanylate cyclase domain-containing protein [Casimicrobiaceae bacterium]|nr:adenylate/guanylate cyclase domain-containing protein [Casimicrobiaceae bacterium]